VYDEVSAYPPPPDRGTEVAALGTSAPYALPLLMTAEDGQGLSFVSVITTFNTPMDVTVSELALETFLPADAATADYLRQR
jgi:hypothetical protein